VRAGAPARHEPRRRAVSLGSKCRRAAKRIRIPAGGRTIPGEEAVRIRIGIDPGREVEERFWSVREQPASRTKRRRPCRSGSPNRRRGSCRFALALLAIAARTLPGLSAAADGRDRPSGDVDRRLDRRVRPLAQSRSPSLPSSACGVGREGARAPRALLRFLVVLAIVGSIAFVIERLILHLPFGIFVVALIASTLIAQPQPVPARRRCRRRGSRPATSPQAAAVSHIVGRDTGTLDAAGVARAAIESLRKISPSGCSAGAVARRCRSSRRRALQGHQYRRQHDRPPHRGATRPSAGRRRNSTISSICRRRGWRRCWLIGAAAMKTPGARPKPGARSGSTRRATARRTQAIRKRHGRRARPVRRRPGASMAACASTMQPWRRPLGRQRNRHSPRAGALSSRRHDPDRGPRRRDCHGHRAKFEKKIEIEMHREMRRQAIERPLDSRDVISNVRRPAAKRLSQAARWRSSANSP